MATIEFLRAEIERIGLSHLAPHILAHAKPCIDMALNISGKWDSDTDTVIDNTPVGTSKYSGIPDVPPNFEWPYIEEQPLPFLAQIRLDEIAPFDTNNELPHTGLLLFFFDITLVIWPDTCVYHVEDVNGLGRATPPGDLPEFGIVEPHTISFSKGWSLPALPSLEMEAVFENYGSSLQEVRYREMDAYNEWYFGAGKYHQLLGHAYYLHRDTRYDVASSFDDPDSGSDFSLKHPENWRLLLQFGSELEIEGAFIQWGNKNCIHLLIYDSDLKSRNFSRVYEFS